VIKLDFSKIVAPKQLRSKLAFGKYKGHWLDDVIRFDPDYIDYLENHMVDFTLGDEASQLLDEVMLEKFPGNDSSQEGNYSTLT
jgi:hypothetical protein